MALFHESIVGEPEDFGLFQARLQESFSDDKLLVVGGVGRAAIEWDLEWSSAAWLHLRSDNGWRDIDVLKPFSSDVTQPLDEGKFVLDYGVNLFINGGINPSMLVDHEHPLDLDPQLFEPRVRQFAGTPVRTLTLGTMFLFEQLMPRNTLDIAKRQRVTERISELTQWARKEHPDEFLDDSAYEPYVELGRTTQRNLGLVLTRQRPRR